MRICSAPASRQDTKGTKINREVVAALKETTVSFFCDDQPSPFLLAITFKVSTKTWAYQSFIKLLLCMSEKLAQMERTQSLLSKSLSSNRGRHVYFYPQQNFSRVIKIFNSLPELLSITLYSTLHHAHHPVLSSLTCLPL